MIQLYVGLAFRPKTDPGAVTLSPRSFPNPTPTGSRRQGRSQHSPHQFLHTMRPAGRTEHEWEATEYWKGRRTGKWAAERRGEEEKV